MPPPSLLGPARDLALALWASALELYLDLPPSQRVGVVAALLLTLACCGTISTRLLVRLGPAQDAYNRTYDQKRLKGVSRGNARAAATAAYLSELATAFDLLWPSWLCELCSCGSCGDVCLRCTSLAY